MLVDHVTKIKTDICKFIVKKENKEVECEKEVTYENSTSNMWMHLLSIHDQALAEFIINNSQLLTILSSQKFIAFCQALDLYYQVPNDKALKCMINKAYLYNYLGITCHWIDNKMNLHEIILGNQCCEYPYIAENIKEA
ncbi:39567_t:CDS:2, partial [Gigaspora margarita]